MSILNLLSRLPASAAQGILWGIMALGVFITFRILDIADLSVDGTFATGGAVSVMLIINGCSAVVSLIVALFAGIIAGIITGLLHTKLKIPAILSGILTQFALYSINLRIMGMKANQTASIKNYGLIFENSKGFLLSSRYITAAIIVGIILSAVLIVLLYWYFGTEQGSALRATGSNSVMASAMGINVNNMKILGLALSNGIVALAGALMTQFQGTADVNMGRGSIVIGLAAIVIGEVICDALFSKGCNFGIRLAFILVGGILYYFVMTVILWLKLDPNDLKLFTAIIVAVFLSIPNLKKKAGVRNARA